MKIFTKVSFLLFSILSLAQHPKNVREFQNDYSDSFSRNTETVFLHLNKTAFLPNEELWFSAYVLDLQNSKPLSDAANLLINVYDSQGNFVDKETVFVWNGKASGYLDLTKNIYSPGKYYIKAQTPYMQDQMKDLSYSGSFSIVHDPYSAKEVKPKYNIQVLAEGGDLLANVENSLGIKLESSTNEVPDFQGYLLNKENDTLNRFNSNQYGLAQVSFIPKEDNNYRVELLLGDGEKISREVPDAMSTGISLSANVINEEVFVSVKTNKQSISSLKDKTFHLAISKNADIKNYSFKIPEDSKEALFRFKNDSIFTGVNRITVFDDKFNPVSERLIFNYYKIPEDRISASISKKTGDSIRISLNGENENIYRLSASVLPKNTKSYRPENNILSAVLLKPYVKGNIKDPQYYFDDETDIRKRSYDLNLLLLTQGWSKFEWNEIFDSAKKEQERIKGFKLLGRVKDYSRHEGQIFIRDDKTGLMNLADLKSNGTFEFQNLFLEDSTKLSVGLINSRKGKIKKPVINYRILSNDSKNVQRITDLSNSPNFDRNYTSPIIDFINSSQILETVNISGTKTSEKDEAEKEMIMLNTTSALSKLVEIDEDTERMYHYVTQLIEQNGFRVLRSVGKLQILSKTPVAFRGAVLTPQLYIDGMRIMDFDLLQTMRTDEIDYIYFNRSAMAGYGQGAGNGVIQIKMKDGSYRGLGTKETIKQILVTNGYQQQKKYYAPKYRSYNNNLFQDFGSIGWNADLVITPEAEANFAILNTQQEDINLYIEGFTQSGQLISQKIHLNTK